MRKIHFIINPISGKGRNSVDRVLLEKYFDKNSYSLKLKYTKYAKHAIELTNKSIEENAEIIVACGGDGTINEVASCLVNTGISFGIIPFGSGNGLASNLKIPKSVNMALKNIKSEKRFKMDVGIVNGRYFFSNLGIGFDAEAIKHYEGMKSRGLITYLKASVKSLQSFKYNKFIISFDNKEFEISPFMFFISNSNEMGNDISLTPNALLDDGLLDIVCVKKMNFLRRLFFGFLVLLRKHFALKSVNSFQANSLSIKNIQSNSFEFQTDGEFFSIYSKELNVSVLKKSLIVCSSLGAS